MSFQPSITKRNWYVVYSKPQKESCAKFHIRAKGLEVYFPRLSLPKNSMRAKPIIPLFPNYLFVRLNVRSAEYDYVAWSPGVKRIVGFNGSPAPIDDEILTFLMSKSDSDGIIPAESNLRTGQEVRITKGPFSGLLGIIREPSNAKGRVRVLLTLLNRDMDVELPIHFVDSAWIASTSRRGS
jgi:transcriptional antiterminator RfaH